MTDPEKKKKLEDIKRKRRELMEQLNQSKDRKEKSTKTVEQEAKEALDKASRANKVPVESFGVVEQTADIVSKYIKSKKGSEFKTVNFVETFPAYKPELYDEGTQWYDENKYEDEDSDNEVKEEVQSKPREPLIFQKNKKITSNQDNKLVDKKYEVIPEEERDQYIKNYKDEINEFLKYKKKHMERAVNEVDIYNMFLNDDYEYQNSLPDSGNLVHPIMEFHDESCAKKTVTSLEWSLKYPELLLACYSKRTDDFNANQKNGLIHIWSLAVRKVPEFTFTCQPEITSAIFHPYNPKLIMGGTHTGQVLIWDTRGKQTAVYKTPLGLGGQSGVKTHTSDITCLGVIGSTNSSHIVSLSNGVICLWSLNDLSKPVKRIELKVPLQKKENDDLNEMCILSMGMQQYDTNNLLIGSDDNNVYQISLNEDSSKNVILNTFTGHDGPVYSVDFHPSDYFNTCNFSHLFATSSADWTTKIWSKQNTSSPLITLENSNNYVYCSKWSPTNASVLATGDGNGYLDILDLNKDIETPRVHCKLGNEALNKICWTEDGKRITVGDSSGKIQLFALDKQIYTSNSEDSKRFEKLIEKMK